MRLEAIPKYFSPKSLHISDSPCATHSESLTGTDIMTGLGMTQSKAGFGLSLFLAKTNISEEDKSRAIELLAQYAIRNAPKHVGKAAGRKMALCMMILAKMAYEDYSRSAETPGARCRCNGTGRAVDKEKTKIFKAPVVKVCERCEGRGFKRLPSSVAFNAIKHLLPELPQQTWSRNWKPFYDDLIQQCYKEESCADSIFNFVTK